MERDPEVNPRPGGVPGGAAARAHAAGRVPRIPTMSPAPARALTLAAAALADILSLQRRARLLGPELRAAAAGASRHRPDQQRPGASGAGGGGGRGGPAHGEGTQLGQKSGNARPARVSAPGRAQQAPVRARGLAQPPGALAARPAAPQRPASVPAPLEQAAGQGRGVSGLSRRGTAGGRTDLPGRPGPLSMPGRRGRGPAWAGQERGGARRGRGHSRGGASGRGPLPPGSAPVTEGKAQFPK